ncbi:hypothetical protein PISMIDRAFT_687518, partial [Pisolithus microcarpus 441]
MAGSFDRRHSVTGPTKGFRTAWLEVKLTGAYLGAELLSGTCLRRRWTLPGIKSLAYRSLAIQNEIYIFVGVACNLLFH